jgi:hypothetical protein
MTPTMSPDLQSSLICDDVRQERNGKFILIGLFDAIALPRYPATFQRLCIVNRWCCGEGTFVQHSRLLAPDQMAVVAESKPVQLKLPDTEATATCIEFFLNVRFENPGTYWIEIMLENQLKLRYPLRAALVQHPPQQSHPS